jgi:hypothetical protein
VQHDEREEDDREPEIRKSPRIHCTMSSPTTGIAPKSEMITCAPQKDICPHGST